MNWARGKPLRRARTRTLNSYKMSPEENDSLPGWEDYIILKLTISVQGHKKPRQV